MDESETNDILLVFDVENVFLIAPYTEEEVKKGCLPDETQQGPKIGWLPIQLLPELLGYQQNRSARIVQFSSCLTTRTI
jgi:hypothetical protein